MSFRLDWSILGPIVIVITFSSFFFIIFFASQYRKFDTNEFVIHLRNGKVWREGPGGHAVLMPLFDKVVIIPTGKCARVVQQTNFHGGSIQAETGPPLGEILLSARTRIPSEEYLKGTLVKIVEFDGDICVVEA